MKSVDDVSQQLLDKLSYNQHIENSIEQSAPLSVTQPSASSKPTTSSKPSVAISIDATESEEPELKLGTKRARTSKVWNDFDLQIVDGKQKAVCRYCKKKLNGTSNDGTSHLHAHIKNCPRKKNHDVKQGILRMGTDSSGKTVVESGVVFDQEVSRIKLAKLIIMNELPFMVTEYEPFRDLLSSLQPCFKMPSRNTAKADVIKLYDFEKCKLMKMFESNTSRVAITTDMWTSNQKKGYMVVTAHYVDDSWSLQSRIIRFAYVMTPHTADVLGKVLVKTLLDWNLDNKLSTLTVDNCTTNDSLIKLVLDGISKKHLLLKGSLVHMRCCAHILNLIVKDGLKHIAKCIEKVRDSVVYWNGGPKRVETFEEALRQLKIPFTKKLALDCSTRWNSTYLMLRSVLPYRDAFERLHFIDPQYSSLPSEEEWDIAQEMCKKLHLFYVVTEIFSGTKYPTTNLFFPKICDIKVALNAWENCGVEYFEVMASQMIKKFDKYWNEIHGVMGVAILLDPRFKLKLMEYYYPILYGEEEAKLRIGRVRNICDDLIVEYASRVNIDNAANSSFEPKSCIIPPMEGYEPDPFEHFLENELNKGRGVKSELEFYLEENLIPRDKTVDFDILGWWKQAFKYPTLQLIARDILAIPISTVASESAFSTSGRIVSEKRSKLKPDTIEALMCAQNWLWSEYKGTRMCTDVLAQYNQFVDDEDPDEAVSTMTNY